MLLNGKVNNVERLREQSGASKRKTVAASESGKGIIEILEGLKIGCPVTKKFISGGVNSSRGLALQANLE